jgi:hypothetical protein
MNSTEGDLEDDEKYIHTATNPTGTDTYVAYLSYTQLDPSAIGIQETIGFLSAALGVGINMPQDPDIAGPTATSAASGEYRQLAPIYFVTPPLNYLGPVSSQGTQIIYPYTTGNKTHARTNLPVAYHIQAFSGGGINCISSITVYPSTYTRILSPPAVNGLQVVPYSQNNWQAVSSTQKYIFVDKSVNINYDQIIWGPNPSGGDGTVIVPIRKRALV